MRDAYAVARQKCISFCYGRSKLYARAQNWLSQCFDCDEGWKASKTERRLCDCILTEARIGAVEDFQADMLSDQSSQLRAESAIDSLIEAIHEEGTPCPPMDQTRFAERWGQLLADGYARWNNFQAGSRVPRTFGVHCGSTQKKQLHLDRFLCEWCQDEIFQE